MKKNVYDRPDMSNHENANEEKVLRVVVDIEYS